MTLRRASIGGPVERRMINGVLAMTVNNLVVILIASLAIALFLFDNEFYGPRRSRIMCTVVAWISVVAALVGLDMFLDALLPNWKLW